MIEVTILIPFTNSEGTSFPTNYFAEFGQEMSRLFGPHPQLLAEIDGRRMSSGVLSSERFLLYTLAVPGLLQRAADLMALVAFAKARFAQSAITVRYFGVSEVL